MTRDEMLKFCSVCKNRELDLKRGLVCKLTGEYADFSDRRTNYDYDEQEAKTLASKSEDIVKSEKIGGWLCFFLFQICVSLLVSLILVFTSQWPENVGMYYLLQGLITVPYSMVGIYTVYAFVRRKTDAVFWGYVYLLLCLITNLLSILFGYGSTNAITALIWNVIWSVFFIFSDNVKTLMPKDKRRVRAVDWVLAAIGVVIPSIVCILVYSLARMA